MFLWTDVVQDKAGNALYNASVQVLDYPSGTPTPIYSDFAGTLPITGSTVYTDPTGTYQFFCPNEYISLFIVYQGVIIKEIQGLSIFDGNSGSGGNVTPLSNIAALRALTSSNPAGQVSVAAYYTPPGPGGGLFILDSLDHSSADNGGSIIIDSSSRRWKRPFTGSWSPEEFGAKADATPTSGTDNTVALLSLYADLASHPQGGTCVYGGPYGVGTVLNARILLWASNIRHLSSTPAGEDNLLLLANTIGQSGSVTLNGLFGPDAGSESVSTTSVYFGPGFTVNLNGANNLQNTGGTKNKGAAFFCVTGSDITLDQPMVKNCAGNQAISFTSTEAAPMERIYILSPKIHNVADTIAGNTGSNDHSSIYLGAYDSYVDGGTFWNDSQSEFASAVEIHGSRTWGRNYTTVNYGNGEVIGSQSVSDSQTVGSGFTGNTHSSLWQWGHVGAVQTGGVFRNVTVRGNIYVRNPASTANEPLIDYTAFTTAAGTDLLIEDNFCDGGASSTSGSMNNAMGISTINMEGLIVRGNRIKNTYSRAVTVITQTTAKTVVEGNEATDTNWTTNASFRDAYSIQADGSANGLIVTNGNIAQNTGSNTNIVTGMTRVLGSGTTVARWDCKGNVFKNVNVSFADFGTFTGGDVGDLNMDHDGDDDPRTNPCYASSGSKFRCRNGNYQGGIFEIRDATAGAVNTWAVTLYQSAAPGSAIQYFVGDMVWFPVPVSGQFIGAVCTTGGTPGTWKNWGAVT